MKGSNSSRTLALLSLVIAGETIFLLPFVLARIFRPTFLDVFGISNLQLGTAFSLYGVVAMVSYFVGGPLADRFSARRLIVTAMLFTSAGGVMMSTIPALGLLTLLYGFWGLTTIFLFWGALIKTTREIGNSNQGQTYGLLDGGRGLLAAVLSSFSVAIFAALLPQDIGTSTLEQRAEALSMLILIFSGFGLLSAIIVWFFLPESNESDNLNAPHKPLINFQTIKKVGSMRTVWLQALIILCAYVAYKSTDDFSLYARDAFGYNELEAAKIATLSFWMRPIAAVAVGFLADKLNSQVALLGS